MSELRREYLSLQCIWLDVFVILRTKFRLNPQSIVVWLLRILLLETGAKSEL